MKINNFP